MAARRTVPSYCRICPALCGIEVELDGDRIVAVRGDKNHPVSAGYTCPKGRALADEHEDPSRVRSSLRREADGTLTPIASVDAVAEVGARMSAIVAEHGPRAVGLYVGTRGYEILPLAAAAAWLDGIGSPSLYTTWTIDQPGKDLALAMHGSWPAGFQDAVTSDVLLLVGINPLVSGFTPYISFPVANPRVALAEARRRGQCLIVIDPRRTETAALADIHLQPRPGTDSALLAGMIRVVLTEDLHDRAFVDRWARGIDSLRVAVDPFTPERTGDLAGVDPELLVAAARRFAAGPRGSAVAGTGTNMAPNPVLAEYLLLCLNTLCGRYRHSGEVIPNPGVLTICRTPRAGARGPQPIWGGGGPQPRVRGLATMYGQMPTAALADEILEPGDGQIRALVVSGGNPVVALPDAARAERALASLDLLVCLDVRMTATARLADYVVGCRLSLEKADATLGNDLRFPAPFAQYAAPVRDPRCDVVEEWEFFWALAQSMGTPWDINGRIGIPIPLDVPGELPTDRKPTTEELWELLSAGGRVPLAEVRNHPHGLAPELPEVRVLAESDDNHDRFELAEPTLLLELASVSTTAAEDPRFPLRLTSRRLWERHNSWGHDVVRLRGDGPAAPAFAHPDTLLERGIESGDDVVVTSAHGQVQAVAIADPGLRPDVVSVPHCGEADECTNQLVDASTDVSQIVGMPRMSAIPVSLERAVRRPGSIGSG